MRNLYVNNKKVGEYDEKTNSIIIRKNIIHHLYRHLHSFNINIDLIKFNCEWNEIRFVTDLTTFSIKRFEFELFNKKFSTIISFGDERQYAIPLSIMKETNNQTLRVISSPSTVLDFAESINKPNSKYVNWSKRYNDWGLI